MTASEASSESDVSRQLLPTFCVMWACASLFHQVTALGAMTKPPAFLMVLAAFALIAKPSSIPRMATLMVFQIWEAWTHLPGGSNHWLFTALINVAFLGALFLVWLRERRAGPIDGAMVFAVAAPVVRFMVPVLYFYVVFHKLNTDYLYEDWSCGAEFWRAHATRFPFLPTGPFFETFSIYITLVAETAIPVLLAIRPTRHLGMAFGAWFHFVISTNPINPFFNFSSMLFAIFALYAMEDFVDLWNRMGRPVADRLLAALTPAREALSQPGVRLALLTVAGVVVVAGGAYLMQFSIEDRKAVAGFVYGIALPASLTIWLLYALPLLAMFSLLALEPVPKVRSSAFHVPFKILLVIPLVAFLNGASPYLGLKTKTTFAMFSNLITSEARYNHVMMSPKFKIANYQDDLVDVLDSSDETLLGVQRGHSRITWFELVRLTSKVPDASITYRRDGVERHVARIGDDPELSRPHPYLLDKIFLFHLIDRRPQSKCKH